MAVKSEPGYQKMGCEQRSGGKALSASLDRWWRGLKDFLYGFFIYGMVEEVAGRKREQEQVFLLIMMGDLVGLPIFSGYYKLRFLPYCLPRLARWKKEVIRPKDLFSMVQE
ncbi:MAG: hypothetical protein P8182_12745 [Deltaproteobacteria bacterium]